MKNQIMERTMGTCESRHPMPVESFVFPQQIEEVFNFQGLYEKARKKLLDEFPEAYVSTVGLPNQADYTDIPVYVRGTLHLYITGLTQVTDAVDSAARDLGITVVKYYHDRETNEYRPHQW